MINKQYNFHELNNYNLENTTTSKLLCYQAQGWMNICFIIFRLSIFCHSYMCYYSWLQFTTVNNKDYSTKNWGGGFIFNNDLDEIDCALRGHGKTWEQQSVSLSCEWQLFPTEMKDPPPHLFIGISHTYIAYHLIVNIGAQSHHKSSSILLHTWH